MQRDRVYFHLRPAAWVTAAFVLLVLGLAPASSGGTEAKCRNCTPIAPPPPGKVIAQVSFAGGKPRDWEVVSDSSTRRAGKTLSVTTVSRRYFYVLAGPPFTVTPGKYSVRLYGEVTDGGLTLGVIAAKKPWNWHGSANYAAHQAGMGKLPLSVSFTVRSPEKLRIVLANFRRGDQSSRWTLRRLSTVRNS